MPKKAKHKKKLLTEKPQEIIIREGKPAEVSHEDYYAVPETGQEQGAEEKPPLKKPGKKSVGALSTRAIIRIALLSFVAVLALVIFLNRDNFAPENLMLWFRTKLIGTGVGDGYPVTLTGSNAHNGNFIDFEGNCAVLSDTTFTVLNSTGKEQVHFNHSYNSPAMAYAQGRFLLYNSGGTSYAITSVDEVDKRTAPDKITAGAIAKNGRYALAVQPSDYASRLNVYLPGGTLKAFYELADAYISAVAINADGTGGMAAAVQSENGKLYSTLYQFDFNSDKPVRTYNTDDNLITQIIYHRDGAVYAVGDKSVIHWGGGDSFTEYSYAGKSVTAIAAEESAVLVSVSGYSRGGPCTVLAFTGGAAPAEIPTEAHVSALTAYGNSFAVLMDNTVTAFDYSGKPLGTCAAGYDAKGISLANERDVYILGVREIRFSTIGLDTATPAPAVSPSPEPAAPTPESTGGTPAPE